MLNTGRFILLVLWFAFAVEYVLCVSITIRGSLQRVYNSADPETVKLECVNSEQRLINQSVTWVRNGVDTVSSSNPLILDRNKFGDNPAQQHEGRYRCTYMDNLSTKEVAVYGEFNSITDSDKAIHFSKCCHIYRRISNSDLGTDQ